MRPELILPVKTHTHYALLKRERNRLSVVLALLIIFVYFSFILTIAFFPSLLATPLYTGSVISVGIPIGVSIIIFSFVLTGIYVHKANSLYDSYIKTIHEDVL